MEGRCAPRGAVRLWPRAGAGGGPGGTRWDGKGREERGAGRYSHEGVVDEGPAAGPLQHVVQVVLQPAVLGVPAAARPAAVRQRLPQQAHAGAVLPAASLPQPGGGGRAASAQEQQAVAAGRRTRQRPAPARLHILHARRRAALHPEPRGAALLPAAVVAGHGITPDAGASAGASAQQGAGGGGQAPRGGGPQEAAGAEGLRAAPAGRGGAGHFGRPARRAELRQVRGGPGEGAGAPPGALSSRAAWLRGPGRGGGRAAPRSSGGEAAVRRCLSPPAPSLAPAALGPAGAGQAVALAPSGADSRREGQVGRGRQGPRCRAPPRPGEQSAKAAAVPAVGRAAGGWWDAAPAGYARAREMSI